MCEKKPLTTRPLWFRSGTPFEQESAHVLAGNVYTDSVGNVCDEGITGIESCGHCQGDKANVHRSCRRFIARSSSALSNQRTEMIVSGLRKTPGN